MKHINFLLGGGFVYQWWVGEYIKYCINNLNKEDNDYTKRFSNRIKDIIKDSFGDNINKRNIDIFLEGDGKCFEDINILYNNGLETKLILIQVKGGNTTKLIDGLYNNDKTLYQINKRKKLIKNMLENQNIFNNNGNKFVVISNKKIYNSLKKIENIDLNIPEEKNKLISIIQTEVVQIGVNKKIFRIKNINKHKKLQKFISNIIDNINNPDSTTHGELFHDLKSQHIIENYINKMLLIINGKFNSIENLKLDIIINKLVKEYGYDNIINKFYNTAIKSIDISTINKKNGNFKRYKKYNDIFYQDGKKITDIQEIREGKFTRL